MFLNKFSFTSFFCISVFQEYMEINNYRCWIKNRESFDLNFWKHKICLGNTFCNFSWANNFFLKELMFKFTINRLLESPLFVLINSSNLELLQSVSEVL